MTSDGAVPTARLAAERQKALARLLEARGIGSPRAHGILPREDPSEFPVSFSQQRLWLLDRLEPGSPRYNVFTSVNLTGVLDASVLERALTEVLRRHEVLRARFVDVTGEPVQRIEPLTPVSLPLVDVSDRSAEGGRRELLRLAVEAARLPYDLSRGPLYRFSLVRFSPTHHALLLGFHHVVSDAWSLGVLLQELAALYAAFRAGETSPFPDLPVQYADFAAWQREWLRGPVLEKELSYWRGKLQGLGSLALPTDRPRPRVQGFDGGTRSRLLPRDVAAALKALSQREGVTLFVTLLAAFQTLLHRYTGEVDVAVGSPVANRGHAQLEGMVGLFVNMLVLRTDLSGDPTFRELLRRVRETVVGAIAHQHLPFEKLVEELAPERDLSRHPLFQVSFVLQQETRTLVRVPGLELKVGADAGMDSQVAKFDLSLYVSDDDEGLLESIEYSSDLFEPASVDRMLGHFRTLVEGVARDPDARLSDLPLCTEAERWRLLVEWNDAHRSFPEQAALQELIESQVERTPEAEAVVFGDVRITYRELDRRASRAARRLRALGVGPESLVGLFLPRSPEMVVGLLAVLKAGGAYVPLDPSYPTERLAYMLEDAGVLTVVTSSALLERLPPGQARPFCTDSDDEEGADGAETEEPKRPQVRADNLAYVIYTSGSTGRPKGVMIPHRGLVNYLSWAAAAYAEGGGRSLVHSPLAFDLTVTSLLLPLVTGGTVELLPEGQIEGLALRLQKGGESGLLKITPAHLKALDPLVDGDARWPRMLVVGGEALLGEDLGAVRARSPQTWIINEYGPTETVVGCCVHRVRAGEASPGPVPIGRPVGNARLYVVDASLNLVPVGVAGELLVGGAGVSRGYWKRPDLTAEKFLPDPFGAEPGARLYRTGDRVRYREDGTLEYLGRADGQVKVRGYRIEPGEIEAFLTEHPAVRQCAVTVREDRPGDRRLVAYVVAEPPAAASELRAFLQARMPEYMLPSAFVPLKALPLTPNGKVAHRALPAPEGAVRQEGEEFVAPRTALEQVVAATFGRVLGRDGVGANDSFFGLGGHSLLATQVVSRLRDAFRAEVPLRLLFEASTVSGLAGALEADPERGRRFGQIAEVLLRVAQMSENEAERLLAERDR